MQITKTGGSTLSAKKLEAKMKISTILKIIGNPDGTGIGDARTVKYLHALRDKWIPNETDENEMSCKLRILATIGREVRGEHSLKNGAFRRRNVTGLELE